MPYQFISSHGSPTTQIEERITTCVYEQDGPTMFSRSVPIEYWREFCSNVTEPNFPPQPSIPDSIAVPTNIPSKRTLYNTCFDLGVNFRAWASAHSTESDLHFGRCGRHFLAGIAWSALVDCIKDVSQKGWGKSKRNVLDVGNAGETWLYQALKIQGVDTHVDNLKYFTLDVVGGQKDNGSKVSQSVDRADWTEIVHDARLVSEIDKDIFPEEGFDVIHIAQASCELMSFEEYSGILESLYGLLAPGGHMIFPIKKFEATPGLDPLAQLGTTYETESGSYTIGEDVPIIDEEIERAVLENLGAPLGFSNMYFIWFYQCVSLFFATNYSDSWERYFEDYLSARRIMHLDSLSFYPDIKLRSTSIQLSDVLFSANSATLSARSLFTVTKPR